MKYTCRFCALLLLLLLLGASCDDNTTPPAGSEGGPCYGNGSCDTGLICSGSDICVLPAGPCDGVTCSDHGTCIDTAGTAGCECETGYVAEGLTCVEASPCDGVTCSDHGTCVDNAGTAECDCETSYSAVGLECIEIGPCDGVTCSDHGTCIDNAGTAECDCETGYSAVGLECLEGGYALVGTFTIVNNPDIVNGTDMFDPIENVSIDFLFLFDVVDVVNQDDQFASIRSTCITSGPVSMLFTGDSAETLDQLVTAFGSEPLEFCLGHRYGGFTYSSMFPWTWASPAGSVSYEISFGEQDISVPLDPQGFPEIGPFQITDTTINLIRFANSQPTDNAFGQTTLSLQ